MSAHQDKKSAAADVSAEDDIEQKSPDAASAAPAEQNIASELANANERLLRLQAEMQNLRNRTSREIADERRYAALPLLRELLPVVDNIDRAIEAAEKAGEAENLLAGFRLVKQQLHTILTQHHCEPIAAENETFDPNFHAAILHQPSADVPAGNIIQVTQSGYKLHDRVVRPAQVIVSSGPPG
ncbi:MAG TPA: nucleotide exchange factor GrpE [Lacipirellulaceae bacterium]|nr:nucleotide exchange factor GrpE [Lacipirellulaceae bacterium]